MTGAGRVQPFALVLLGADVMKGNREELSAGLAAHLETVNAKLESHEKLAFCVVVAEPWLPDNGLLTPTMKIKRGEIERHYEPNVDGWYSDGRPLLWQ